MLSAYFLGLAVECLGFGVFSDLAKDGSKPLVRLREIGMVGWKALLTDRQGLAGGVFGFGGLPRW